MHVGPTSSTQPRDSRSPVAASHGVQDGFCPESQVAVLSAAGCELHLCPELKKRAHTHTHTIIYIYIHNRLVYIYTYDDSYVYQVHENKHDITLRHITLRTPVYSYTCRVYSILCASANWGRIRTMEVGHAACTSQHAHPAILATWVWKSGLQVLSPTHLCMRVSLFPVSQICWWETGEYTFPAHSDK